MPPSLLPFPDPPTKDTLAGARRLLETNRTSIQALNARIDAAEATLARIVRESRCAIGDMEKERERLRKKELATLAYLSPVRRLPQELVREIFMWCFEEHPCCAWVLAAVSTSWRRLALRMPFLWSKVSSYTMHRDPRFDPSFPSLPKAALRFGKSSLLVFPNWTQSPLYRPPPRPCPHPSAHSFENPSLSGRKLVNNAN
jgi:hypothetical protein